MPCKSIVNAANIKAGKHKGDAVPSGDKSELYLIEEHQQIQAQWSVGGLALVWPEAEFICCGIVGDGTVSF